MNTAKAREFAIRGIVRVERPSVERLAQINRLDNWDLSTVFFKHFGYDVQAHITNTPGFRNLPE